MLYQQGTQRIEIIVRKDAGASTQGANEKDADQTADGQTSSTASATSSSSSQSKRFLKVNITHGIAVAKQITDASIQYAIQGIGNKYGDQALQENIEQRFDIAKDVLGSASSVAMGALYGSAGGPLGALLGGIFGLVSSATSLGFKYAGKEREFDYKQFKENNAIEYQRARASISLTTGRLR